ncbi:hypothetical protein CF65_02585 [Aggregatibacter actinomycetemcomitans HK1651]|nr:hypothetical protein CF65_02585 [Aggregatibacter actinomycetemcomitans HK1651]
MPSASQKPQCLGWRNSVLKVGRTDFAIKELQDYFNWFSLAEFLGNSISPVVVLAKFFILYKRKSNGSIFCTI